jgi:hypothetical protein
VGHVIASGGLARQGERMIVGKLVAVPALALFLAAPSQAQDARSSPSRSLGPELSLDLARAALGECRKRSYQAAAVVDRFGVTLVMLRGRCATGWISSRQPGSGGTRSALV